jgi:hypothetical protein
VARKFRAGALLLAAALTAFGCSSVREVKLKVPLRPRLPLKGNERVTIAPFLIVQEAEKARDTEKLKNIDLQGEFHQYLTRQLEKKTKLTIVSAPDSTKLPTRDLLDLARDADFWRALGSATSADIIVSGSLDFKIEDRSGYRTEEYVSPINGRTYYRQVYVEQTGFLFDIVFLVFDGHSGEKILQDEFKDFREKSRRQTDQLLGLFENLFSLENQILNLFVARDKQVERYLYTD